MERNPQFLDKKFNDLRNAPEVSNIVARAKSKADESGETVSAEKPVDRIQLYLDYLTESLDPNNPKRAEKMDRFKTALYDKFVLKPDDLPETYINSQRRMARDQGHGDIDVTDEMRRQWSEILIADQKSSLNMWTDYLASPDATYPDWLKYWAIRSILTLEPYDKEDKKFSKRRKDTTKPFPDLDREALSYVLDFVHKKYSKMAIDVEDLADEDQAKLQRLLSEESFARLYAFAIEQCTPASKELLTNTKGEWIKYPQYSDPTPLVKSLQGHGTGWCTAGEGVAHTQLQAGDFYVYYSHDQKGKSTIPRAAIRMQEGSIAEVRGIAEQQNLDGYISPVVQAKLTEFPDGKQYEKKANDMKVLTDISRLYNPETQQWKRPLTKLELTFLYELDSSIEGFGYETDPRIVELRQARKDAGLLDTDMLTIFDCESNQIATNKEQIAKNKEQNIETKAYIGPLYSNIFVDLIDIENIYTTFPEGRIRRRDISVGGEDATVLEKKMKAENINISDYAKFMLAHKDFTVSKDKKSVGTVRLKVRDLGFSNGATVQEIYAKAEELGLDLCPAEVGPHYRLQYTNQPAGEYMYIAMKQISGPDGIPVVFSLVRGGVGPWLYDYGWAGPAGHWRADLGVVFSLRK